MFKFKEFLESSAQFGLGQTWTVKFENLEASDVGLAILHQSVNVHSILHR